MAESTVLVPSSGGFTVTGGWITEGPDSIAPIVAWKMDPKPESATLETVAPEALGIEGIDLTDKIRWVRTDSMLPLTDSMLPLTDKSRRSEPRRYEYPVIGDSLPDAEFPRAEVLWLAERLRRSEYERGQLKAENRRLLRRLRKLRHRRGKR